VSDPHDPRQGIIGGARYLQKLANIYHGDLWRTIAAYNAGPGNVRPSSKVHEWPYATRDYLRDVLRRLSAPIKKLSYHPLSRMDAKRRPPIKEGGPIDRMTGNTDLSGRKERVPELDDAELANIKEMVVSRLVSLLETRMTDVVVTQGRFQPFHRGHAEAIRAMLGDAPKVVIFSEPAGPFDHQLTMDLMHASLPDIWDRLEIYPAAGDIGRSISSRADRPGSTLHNNSRVVQMPSDEGNMSGKRVVEALQDDDKDMVRKMLDPHVSTQEARFEELYGRLRRAVSASGKDTVEVVTDAPVPEHRPDGIDEMSAGAMATTIGDTRTGRHGGSAWSSYNPRNKAPDGDTIFQQMLRSPTTRMLDMTNPGVPDNHTPGEELDHHIDDPADPDCPEELSDPTDLSDMIIRRMRNIT